MKLPGGAGVRVRIIRDRRLLLGVVLAAAALCWLMFYRLGSLTGGLSRGELAAAIAPVGWHGIYADPLYLPLKVLRSVVFFIAPTHGQLLTRLPNVIFGALAVTSFAALIRLWHGWRTAVLATVLFMAAAWTLHISRLASFDVMYFWAVPTLLLAHFAIRKYCSNPYVWFGNLCVWGALLYIPGLIWFVAADVIWQRGFLVKGWQDARGWTVRLLYAVVALIWLPLLVIDLSRSGSIDVRTWLGLPAHFGTVHELLKQFIAVPVHLFVRGPEYPQSWLGRAPVLDVFVLAICLLGMYFYISRLKASRSRYLASLALMGWILVALGGPVPLSVLVPLLYVAAATGIAYLLREWLKTFPNNPLARGLGLGLIVLAVTLSCLYNYRAYFVAWPHSAATKATFQYHRRP